PLLGSRLTISEIPPERRAIREANWRNRDVATVRYSACTNEKPLDAWSTSGLTTYAQLQTSQYKLPATVAHSVEAGDTGTREGSSQTGGACVKTAAERKWKI